MNKDLIVEIPKRFKERLKKRFDLRRAKLSDTGFSWTIEQSCPLCEEYKKESISPAYKCKGCPFNKHRKPTLCGCVSWMNDIYARESTCGIMGMNGDEMFIYNKQRFKEWRKEAKKYIRWV